MSKAKGKVFFKKITLAQIQSSDEFGSARLLPQTLFQEIISQNLKTVQTSLAENW